MDKKIGIIGLGNMGAAIYKQLVKAYPAELIYGCDQLENKGQELAINNFFTSVTEIIQAVDVVFLVVKPQVFSNWSDVASLADKLVISVMAGVSISKIKELTRANKVIRSMPNLGIQVGQGVVGWLASEEVSQIEKSEIRQLLTNMGVEIELDEEDKLNAITALSGSGPAYFYYFCKLLTTKAIELGFTQEQAQKLAQTTFFGSAKLLESSEKSSQELSKAVTSKGGTTQAALEILSKDEFKDILFQAVDEAYKRAQELSK